jgi:hypothetical protein
MPNLMVFTGEVLGAYGFGEDHPFGPDRYAAFDQRYRELGLDKQVQESAPRIVVMDIWMRGIRLLLRAFMRRRQPWWVLPWKQLMRLCRGGANGLLFLLPDCTMPVAIKRQAFVSLMIVAS